MLTILMKIGSPQDDKNIAHLTHVSEMEKKCESLARITTILKDVIQNKVIEVTNCSFTCLSWDYQLFRLIV